MARNNPRMTSLMPAVERQRAGGRPRRGARVPAPVFAVFFLIAALDLFMPGTSLASDIILEAETFLDSQDYGLDPVTIATCSDASGGLAVDGVDAVGDEIVLGLSLADPFCFRPGVESGGDDTLVRVFEVSIRDAGGDGVLFADTLTTLPGTGVG